MTIKNGLLAGVAAAGLLLAVPALAQEAGVPGQGLDAPDFETVDTNSDNVIDETELQIATGLEGMADVYDEDGDDALSEDEYTAFLENQSLADPGGQGEVGANEAADAAESGTDTEADTESGETAIE